MTKLKLFFRKEIRTIMKEVDLSVREATLSLQVMHTSLTDGTSDLLRVINQPFYYLLTNQFCCMFQCPMDVKRHVNNLKFAENYTKNWQTLCQAANTIVTMIIGHTSHKDCLFLLRWQFSLKLVFWFNVTPLPKYLGVSWNVIFLKTGLYFFILRISRSLDLLSIISAIICLIINQVNIFLYSEQ